MDIVNEFNMCNNGLNELVLLKVWPLSALTSTVAIGVQHSQRFWYHLLYLLPKPSVLDQLQIVEVSWMTDWGVGREFGGWLERRLYCRCLWPKANVTPSQIINSLWIVSTLGALHVFLKMLKLCIGKPNWPKQIFADESVNYIICQPKSFQSTKFPLDDQSLLGANGLAKCERMWYGGMIYGSDPLSSAKHHHVVWFQYESLLLFLWVTLIRHWGRRTLLHRYLHLSAGTETSEAPLTTCAAKSCICYWLKSATYPLLVFLSAPDSLCTSKSQVVEQFWACASRSYAIRTFYILKVIPVILFMKF